MASGEKSAVVQGTNRRLSEIPGISQAAVVALERGGFLSCGDLVVADFHRLAYVLDDYNEATRLVREARRICGSAHKESGDPVPPGPLTSGIVNRVPKSAVRQDSTPALEEQTMSIADAVGILAAGLSDPAGHDRESLRRRMFAVSRLLDHNASETELLVACVLEAAESGAMDAAELTRRLGKSAVTLIEECMTLRAVPVLPTGRLPQMFLNMAKDASPEARRVCAAHLAALAGCGGDASYMKLHLEALRSGSEASGGEPLVEAATAAVRGGGSRRAA
jgi:hypothetical protein